MATMQLREALILMEDTERSFSIKFYSFDRSRKKKGSELISLRSCVQVGATHNRKANGTVMVKPIDRSSHPYPVHTHLIIELNGTEVVI